MEASVVFVVIFGFFVTNIFPFSDNNTTARPPDSSTRPYTYGPSRASERRHAWDSEQIEYRLTRLEVQVAEKTENLRLELRESSRRLQALEWKSEEVQTSLESLSSELGRLTETSQSRVFGTNPMNNGKLERHIDNLAKGMQLAIAALRGLNSDIADVKRNVSIISKAANALLDAQSELVTKPFLSDSLVDMKHHNLYHRPGVASEGCSRSEKNLPRNCKEVQERGNNVSGIYRIHPEDAPKPFMVLCDMTTSGGGWTYIHNRYDGSQEFYLDWRSYKHGFGNLGGEFWLGLEALHKLTGSEVNELFVELVDVDTERAQAHYRAFSVGSEVEGYAIKVLAGFSGTAGDSLVYHAGSKFSTKDMDQDHWPEGSCAQSHGGGWWYRSCDNSNLNGKYLSGPLPENYIYQGMYWGEFRGPQYSLLRARMMVRPGNQEDTSIFSEMNKE